MQLVLVGAPYSYTKLYHCKNINRVLEKQPEILIYIYIYIYIERERERERGSKTQPTNEEEDKQKFIRIVLVEF